MLIIIPYIVLLIIAAILTTGLAIFTIRTRPPSGRPFSVLLLGAALWALSHVGELLSATEQAKNISIDVTYVAIAAVVISWLVFAIVHSGNSQWVTPGRVAALALPFAFIIPAVWTNQHHHLFFSVLGVATDAPFPTASYVVYGPLFYVNLVYSYALLLAGLVILLQALIRSPQLYQGQIGALIVGMIVPFIGSIIQTTGLNPEHHFDIVPLLFNVTGLAFGWAIFRHRLFDIAPIARDTVIESMDDAVLVLDNLNRVIDLNPACEALISQPAESVIGKPAAEALTRWGNLFERYRDVPEARTEMALGIGDNEEYFDLRISTLRRRGLPAGRLVVLRDITARKKAEKERERLIEELDAYAHTVAHDLKNPLALIVGTVEAIQLVGSMWPEEKRQQHLDTVARTGRNMANIIDALLLLASVRGIRDVEIHPLDMASIVADVQTRLARQIADSQAVVTAPDEWPGALGFAPWIEEIWANYISNAIKYGGAPPLVEVGATSLPGGMVRFWVRDNGPGLTADEQAQLFTPFSRLHRDRAEGHGLGLSIVQRIAEKLGGTVDVESQKGQGSTFTFTLPGADG
jgi:PAS domain S-box-containing protein